MDYKCYFLLNNSNHIQERPRIVDQQREKVDQCVDLDPSG